MNKNYIIAGVVIFIIGMLAGKIKLPFFPPPLRLASMVLTLVSMVLKLVGIILVIVGLTKKSFTNVTNFTNVKEDENY